jgi:hypothetical protein
MCSTYAVLFCFVVSCRALSCPVGILLMLLSSVMSCPFVSYIIVFCPVLSNRIVWYSDLACSIMPYLPCHIYHAIFIMPYLSCHIYHAIFIMPYLSCHIHHAIFIMPYLSCYIYHAIFIMPYLSCHVPFVMFCPILSLTFTVIMNKNIPVSVMKGYKEVNIWENWEQSFHRCDLIQLIYTLPGNPPLRSIVPAIKAKYS